MRFALTPEQEMIAATARDFFTDHASARRTAVDSAGGFDRSLWTAAVRDLGVGAMTLAEADGGAGLGLVEQALVMIEMGRTLFPSPFLPSIATALPLLRQAGEDALVEAVATGERIAAPLFAPNAEIADDRLNCEALVPFGGEADLFLVLSGDAVLLVEAAHAEVTRPTSMDLTRPLARVRLDRAPFRRLAAKDTAAALDEARVALAAECVGGADAALAASVDYAKQRVQFGRPIGSFQALKHRMADMLVAVEAARTAVYYAAAAIDEGDRQAPEAAAIAHFTAIDTFRMVAGNMIQLHGGIGFTWEHDAHLYFKRARAAGTLLGTPAESRRRLARLIGLDEGIA